MPMDVVDVFYPLVISLCWKSTVTSVLSFFVVYISDTTHIHGWTVYYMRPPEWNVSPYPPFPTCAKDNTYTKEKQIQKVTAQTTRA